MAFILLGIVTGIFAGFFGVGGGIILVPALVYLFQMKQHAAQGMSLMVLLLPVGLLGVISYYKANPFPIKASLWIALGVFIGTYFGSMLAQRISDRTLRIAFGSLMILGGLKFVLGK